MDFSKKFRSGIHFICKRYRKPYEQFTEETSVTFLTETNKNPLLEADFYQEGDLNANDTASMSTKEIVQELYLIFNKDKFVQLLTKEQKENAIQYLKKNLTRRHILQSTNTGFLLTGIGSVTLATIATGGIAACIYPIYIEPIRSLKNFIEDNKIVEKNIRLLEISLSQSG